MPKKKNEKFYFGEEQEDAVRKFLKSKNLKLRNKIYREKLEYPLGKMVESIIRRYKLYRKGMEYQEIYDDTLSFLFSKVDKFNPSLEKKAYSYFGTICKNYLMGIIIKDQKEMNRSIVYEDVARDLEDDIKLSYTILEPEFETNKLLKNLLSEINEVLKTDTLSKNEKILGEALIDIFSNHEKIFQYGEGNKFNKNIIFFSLREMTNLNTKEIRSALKKFKKIYKVVSQKIIV